MAIGETYLTRKDIGVGEGAFDSIAWALSEHVKQEDRPEFQAAVLYGNEDAPDQIDFYLDADPVVGVEPAMTWRAEGEQARPDSRALAECRRLMDQAQDAQDIYWDALAALERQITRTFNGSEIEIDSEDISEGQTLEDLIEKFELEVGE